MNKFAISFILLLLFVSCTPYDFLNDSVSVDSTSPSILFVQVGSPTHRGLALTTDLYLVYHYLDKDTSINSVFDERIYNDIKRNIIFYENDSIDNTLFVPIDTLDSIIFTVANKGIETYIRTFFEGKHPCIKDSTPFRWQIAKIMYDAGIHIRMSEGWQVLYIDDPRFYTSKENGRPYHSFPYPETQERRAYQEKFVIPKSYIRKGKNWYKNTWQKQPKKQD